MQGHEDSSTTAIKPVATAGEIFPNGVVVELVRDAKDPTQLNFLLWDGGNETVAPQVQFDGRVFVPVTPDPTIVQALQLPTHSATYGSTRELFSEIGKLFMRYTKLPEKYASLLAYFVLATWFVDCVPAPVCLSIIGPTHAEAILLLRLLYCLCRHALVLGGVTVAGLCSLLMNLRLTLLIDQEELSRSTRTLLRASNIPHLRVPRRGPLLDLCCAKAIYSGPELQDDAIGQNAIQIGVTPARHQLPRLEQEAQQRIAEDFQAKLLAYRLLNYAKVRCSQFDVPQFTSGTRDLARGLGACIVGDPESQAELIPLLEDQDEESRVECSTTLESVVVEAMLFVCHEGQRNSVYVSEVANVVNTILKGRGETLEFQPRAVGDKLRSLGLSTRRLDSGGRGILLMDADRRRIHRLARGYDVPSVQNGVARCPHCTQTGADADTKDGHDS